MSPVNRKSLDIRWETMGNVSINSSSYNRRTLYGLGHKGAPISDMNSASYPQRGGKSEVAYGLRYVAKDCG